jgi:hypothetical protein
MFLPVQNKPDILPFFEDKVVEIPNVITKDIANELINFANSESSGLHRRGSKNPNFCTASFYTCLVHNTQNFIYEFLDPLWERYIKEYEPLLTFIEPYEIKSYVAGDMFGNHHDYLTSKDKKLARKMNLIVQLSDSSEYDGGDLIAGTVTCSRQFGTGIFFPAYLDHSVTKITSGTRYSLIGHAWGPVAK